MGITQWCSQIFFFFLNIGEGQVIKTNQQDTVIRGVDPSSTLLGDNLVARQHQLHEQVYLRGGVSPQKPKNFVILEMVSCNLMNTFRRKFRPHDDPKKKKKVKKIKNK